MSFVYLKYLVPVLVLWVIFSIVIIRRQKRFYELVEKYWFFKRSRFSKISLVLYLLSFLLFGISLLDLRGKEEQIESNIPDQKTIVIIDSSSSMLVEDVRPNRFKKSLVMARHFVKKAFGHQIAIVLFSDTQKRLVPFTDDIDLLDARIAGLEDTNINRGGSNISQAIRESIQYFKVESGGKKVNSGNILVFTDSEENSAYLETEIPDEINLAVVGVGTLKGGPIPMRNKDGRFVSHKKYKGKKVISKLNEGFLKSLAGQVKKYKYWIASSYALPTDEILNFFRIGFKASFNKGSVRVRPVLANYITIPAIVFFVLSILFRCFKSYSVAFLCMFFIFEGEAVAQDGPIKAQKEHKSFKEELDDYKNGKLGLSEKLKLAENYLKDGQYENAITLYKENIKKIDQANIKALFNYGTSLLGAGKIVEGALVYKKLKYDREVEQSMVNEMRDNLFLAIKQKKDKEKKNDQKKKDDKKQSKDDKKENKENQKESEDNKKESEDNKKQGKDNNKQNKDDKKQKNNSDQENKKKNDKSDKDNTDKEKQGKKPQDRDNQKKKEDLESQKAKEKKKKKPKDMKSLKQKKLEDKESEIEKKRKMVKIPAMVKQIMNDDRKLQERYMNTSTRSKKNRNEKKDW